MRDKQVRRTDPLESHLASKNVSFRKARAANRYRLLVAYQQAGPGHPLTDAEAGKAADVRDPHKRCSELVRDGLILVTAKKPGEFGSPVRACSITDEGRAYIDALNNPTTLF